MGTAKKAVATVEEKKLPAVAYDYGEDAGAGFEGTTSKDLSIPFLNVLQSNSPAVAEGTLKNGDIFNSVTGQVYAGKDGVGFQPVYHEMKYVKWKPRDSGGGILGTFDPHDPYVAATLRFNEDKQYGKLRTEDGNELIETHYVYGNVLDDNGGSDGFAVLAFTSTKISPWKKCQTAMFLLKGKPPIFANRFRMTVVQDKNDKGQAYNTVAFKPYVGTSWADSLIPPGDPLLDAGRELRKLIASGAAKADLSTQEAGGDADIGRAGKTSPDGAVPF